MNVAQISNKIVIIFALSLLSPSIGNAKTYFIQGGKFNGIFIGDGCGKSCAPYTKDQRVSGYFETSEALPPSQAEKDISPLIKAYRFTDGHNVIASTDRRSKIAEFSVATDENGRITKRDIVLQQYIGKGRLPESAALTPRLNAISLFMFGEQTAEMAFDRALCKAEGKAPAAVSSAVCVSLAADPLTAKVENDPGFSKRSKQSVAPASSAAGPAKQPGV